MAACGEPIKAVAGERREPVRACGLRPLIDDGLVHKIGVEDGTRHRRAAFDQARG